MVDFVPAAIKDRPQWVLWQYEAGGRKVPYQVNGKRARTNDHTTWCSFDVAHAAGGQLGFVFAKGDGLFGLDLDGCRNPETGEIADWAQSILSRVNSYAEVSPSGTGVKIFGRGSVPGGTGKQKALDEDAICSKAPAIELYDHGRYFAYTGRRLEQWPEELQDCQDAIDSLVQWYWPAGEAPKQVVPVCTSRFELGDREARAQGYLATIEPPDPRPDNQMDASTRLFRGACVLIGFGVVAGAAERLLAEWDACNPCGPYPPKELARTVTSASKQVVPGSLAAALDRGEFVDLDTFFRSCVLPDCDPVVEPTTVPRVGKSSLPPHLLDVPGFIGDVVRYNLATAPRKQPDLALAGALCLQAVLIGRKLTTELGNRSNVYLIGTGESASGKDHARTVNSEILVHAGLPNLEGPSELASDSGLLAVVAERKAVLIQYDEFGRFLKTIGSPEKQGYLYNVITKLQTLFTEAAKMHRGKAHADKRLDREVYQPCCVLYATSTPDAFYESLTVDSLTGGFVSRILIFEGADKPRLEWVRPSPPPDSILDVARYWGRFESIPDNPFADQNPQPRVVPFTEEASELLKAFAAEADAVQGNKVVVGVWGRAAEKAAKLSLLYAASANHEQPLIDLSAAAWACEMARRQTRRLLELADEHVADGKFDDRQKRVLRLIAQAGGRLEHRALARKTRDWSARERNEILQSLILETQQVGKKTEEETGGRPKTFYFCEN
jgi:hypothetical protein